MSDDASRKERKEPRPRHDEPGERVPYENEKALFEAMLNEAKSG